MICEECGQETPEEKYEPNFWTIQEWAAQKEASEEAPWHQLLSAAKPFLVLEDLFQVKELPGNDHPPDFKYPSTTILGWKERKDYYANRDSGRKPITFRRYNSLFPKDPPEMLGEAEPLE
jgi:hypothetical protein